MENFILSILLALVSSTIDLLNRKKNKGIPVSSIGNSWSKAKLLFAFLIINGSAMAQTNGDYQTRAAGAWTANTTWQVRSGGNWVNCASGDYPGANAGAGLVTVRNNHSVTIPANIPYDISSLVVSSGNNNTSVSFTGAFSLTVTGSTSVTGNTNGITKSIDVGTGTLNTGSITITGGTTSKVAQITLSSGTINCTGNLSFSGTAANAKLTFTGSGVLNIGGSLSTSGTFTASTGTVNYNGTTQTIADLAYNNLTVSNSGVKSAATTITINGNLTVQTGSTLDLNTFTANRGSSGGTISIDGTSSLLIGGTNTFPSNYTTTTLASGSTVNYDGTNQNIAAKAYSNLIVSGSGTKTLQGTITPSGDITVINSIFDLGAYTANRNTSGGTISIDGTSALIIGGTNTFPSNFTTKTLATGSIVNYNGTNQAITANTYSNLTLSGAGVKTFAAGTTTVDGLLSMEGTATTAMTGTLSYGAAATLQYKGAASQTSGAELPTNIANVIINNASGVSLSTSTGVSSSLTLTSGILTVMPSQTLRISSSTGTISGASSSSYIIGSLSRVMTSGTTYTYPVGSSTCGYHQLTFSSLNVAANTELQVTFSCTGATTGDGSTINNPPLGINWGLKYISGTFTDAAVLLEGSEIDFTHTIAQSNLQAGSYSKLSSTAAVGSISASSIGPIAADKWFGIGVPSIKTYYSFQNGSWNAPSFTWTLDPSGTLQVGNTIPSDGDFVYILPGRTVSLPSNVSTQNLTITIQAGGFLDQSTYKFSNTLLSLSGEGTLRLASTNFPTVASNAFVLSGGGTTEYYNSSSFILPTTQAVYNNLIINTTASTYTATQLSGITINGDLSIKQGIFAINDNSSTAKLSLTVYGNVSVSSNGQIAVGQGITNGLISSVTSGNYYNQFHTVTLWGDLSNSGTVKFTNLGSPLYNAFPSTTTSTAAGAATVYFKGTSDNTVNCKGTTIFYNLIVDKGADQTYHLTVNSTANTNFQLYGANSLATDGAVTANPSLQKALWIKNGTLKLEGSIIIPSLSEGTTAGSDYYIPQNGAMVLNGTDVVVFSTADNNSEANTAYSVSSTSGVSVSGGYGALVVLGKLNLSKGVLSTRESAGLLTSSLAAGQIEIGGGTLDAKQFTTTGSAASYTQTGGAFILRGRFQRTLSSNLSDFTTATLNTARTSTGLIGTSGSFQMATTSILTLSGGTIRIYDVCGTGATAAQQKAFDVSASSANINVTGGILEMVPTTGTVSSDASNLLITTTAPLGSLVVNRASGTSVVTLSPCPLTVLNDFNLTNGAFSASGFNVKVGGAFTIEAGTSYAADTTTLNGAGNQIFTVNLASALSLSKFFITKSAGTSVTFAGSQKTINVTDYFNLQLATLNDNGNTLNLQKDVYNSGIHAGTGKIVLNGTVSQTIDGAGVFNNLELNNATGVSSPVSLLANMTINGTLTFSQDKLFNIGIYNLLLNASASIVGSSSSRYIQTAGNSGDGGISKQFANTTPFLFPIGGASSSHVGIPKYTPATIGFSTAPTTYGVVTIIPVGYEHPATTANGQSLTYFWRIKSSGFSGIAANSVTHTFVYDQSDATTETNYIPSLYDRSAYTWNNGTASNINTTSNTITDWTSPTSSKSFLDADYTAGDNTANGGAFGSPKKFYSRQSGLWSAAATWSFTSNLGTANTGTAVPGVNDIVIIGGQDSVYLATNTTTANTDPRSCASLQIEVGSALDIGYNYNSNFGMVLSHPNGNGNFRFTTSWTSGSTFTFPKGDYTDFNSNLGTTELYSTNPAAGTTYWLPNGITSYGNLILSPLGGSNIIFPNNDLTILGNLIIRGQNADSWFCPTWNSDYPLAPTTRIAKTITVKGSMLIQGGALIWYGNNTISQKFVVYNDVVISPWASLYDYDASTGAFSIGRDLINNTTNATASGVGTISKCDFTNIPLTFFGDSPSIITNTGTTPTTGSTPLTVFQKTTINKGTSQATTLTLNIGGTLTTPTDNWLTLQNGTFKYMRNVNTDFTISTTTPFTIPATACLHSEYTTANNILIANSASNTNDLYLNGKLKIVSGNVFIGQVASPVNNNDIEYSGGGASAIEISGGTLTVNGQIRRNPSATSGILSYIQSGGAVNINGKGSLSTNAKLEILNTGSAFNMSGGALNINSGNGGSTFGDLYLRPDVSSVSGGTISLINNASGSNQTYGLESNVPLYNLTITGRTAATAANATVNLMVSPLVLNGTLTLSNANSILNSNNIDITLNGNLVNSGSYNFGTNLTTFSGGMQTITGSSTTNFYDLTVSPSSSLTPNKSFAVNGNLVINSGTLALSSLTATLLGNLTNNSSYTTTLNAVIGGVQLAGTVLQQVSGSGAFGRLELNNSVGAVALSDVSLAGNFALTQGVFDIGSKQLVLSQNSLIEGSSFNVLKMIKTDGVASALGVKKFFPAVSSSTFNFTYPIGVTGKYTPAIYAITASASVGSIRVSPVNTFHPTVLDNTQVLRYYWDIQSSGISSFDGVLKLQYKASDVYGLESSYIAARLEVPGDYWYKAATGPGTDNVDESLHQITFASAGSSNLSADYTAGVSIAIPEQVPTYRTNKAGNWADNTIWTPVGSAPPCPSGGPNGCIVIIDHTVSATTNYCSAYRTTINDVLKIIYPSYGHNLGTVDGSGTLYMETGNLPAGDYTAFLDCMSNATLEYGGSGTYTNIASLYSSVPNLVFSGTGTRILYNRDLTVCKRLVINGPTLDNSVNNRSFFIGGTMERYNTGSFISGTGNAPASTVSFSGSTSQTLGGSLGDFTGSNAFNNLEISNSAGLSINSGGVIEVTNNLLLTNGTITTTPTNQLKLLNTSSSAVIPDGGSASSYINGPLAKLIVNGESFRFPLGKGALKGHDFTFTSAAGSTTSFNAEYFTPNPDLGLTTPLQDITALEYWTMTTASTANGYVKIGWDNTSGLIPSVTLNGLADMRIAQFNSGTSKWEQVGNASTAVTSGTVNLGDVTSTTPVAIGSLGLRYTIASVSLAKPFARFTSTSDVCGTVGIPITFTGFPNAPIKTPYKLDYSISGVAQATVVVSSEPYTLPTPSQGTYLLTGFQYTNSGNTYSTGAVTGASIADYSLPTTAVAGPNQNVCSLSGTTLAANTPSSPNSSAGKWSIASGAGGTFGDNLSPSTSFAGILGNSYNLKWTISNNSCTSSSNVVISFLVAPAMPSSFIATVPTACKVSTSNIYTVPAITGNTYNWSYSGTGYTINSGGTNSASIDFAANATSGTLSVTATNACGVSPARSVALLVNPRGSWLGTTDANWFNISNWSCPGLPISSSDVTIPSTALHQPSIGANGAVAGTLTIQNAASLTLLNTFNLDVYGDFQNNGSLNAASGSSITFKGTTTMSGTSTSTFGNVSITGTLTAPASDVINVTGDWTNTGSFNHNDGTVNFNGSTLQTITNVTSAGEVFNDLNVTNAYEVDLSPSTNVTVNGATNLSGKLVLKSSPIGTANLLNHGLITQTGTAIVEQYTTGNAFHYISSPLSSTSASVFNDLASAHLNRNFLVYDETLPSATLNDNWLKAWVPQLTGAPLSIAKGYALYYEGDRTYSFSGGVLNGANPATAISIPVTKTSHTWSATSIANNRIADGWNLIGNPYPSGFDGSKFLTDNSGVIAGTLYFWDETTPYTSWNANGTDYACWNLAGSIGSPGTGTTTYTPTKYVSVNQGFFVKKLTNGTANVNFTNSMRSVGAVHFFKGEKIIQRAKVSVKNPKNEYNETLVAFIDDATDGYDNAYDGVKMKGSKNLALYTKLEDQDYAIQALPSLQPKDERIIPLGIEAQVDGLYKFNLCLLERIDPSIHVYLIDKTLNKTVDLRTTSSYECQLKGGVYNSRFKLVFTDKDLISNPLNDLYKLKIYASNQQIMIELPAEQISHCSIRIFDVLGKQVFSGSYQDLYLITIPMDAKSGVFLVEVDNNGQKQTKKIFLGSSM